MTTLLGTLASTVAADPDDFAALSALADAMKDAPAAEVVGLLRQWAEIVNFHQTACNDAINRLSFGWSSPEQLSIRQVAPPSLNFDATGMLLERMRHQLAKEIIKQVATEGHWWAIRLREDVRAEPNTIAGGSTVEVSIRALVARLIVTPQSSP